MHLDYLNVFKASEDYLEQMGQACECHLFYFFMERRLLYCVDDMNASQVESCELGRGSASLPSLRMLR